MANSHTFQIKSSYTVLIGAILGIALLCAPVGVYSLVERSVAYASTITDTSTVTVTAVVTGPVVTPPSGGGGGGGGGGSIPGYSVPGYAVDTMSMPNTSVRFTGVAYANGTVNVFKNNVKVDSVASSSSGEFDITVLEKTAGDVLYSLTAIDKNGKSSVMNFNVAVKVGYLTHLSGIHFAPIALEKKLLDVPGDCNFDTTVDIVDFSILAFWYKKPKPPTCADANQDKVVDLVDFSILAFYWTGHH